MIKYLYLTIPRVIIIILEIIACIYIVTQSPISNTISRIFFLISLSFIIIMLINLTIHWLSMPSFNMNMQHVVYGNEVLNLKDIFDVKVYDNKDRELGFCRGIYFTKDYSSIMVKSAEDDMQLYDVKNVYFQDEQDEEGEMDER